MGRRFPWSAIACALGMLVAGTAAARPPSPAVSSESVPEQPAPTGERASKSVQRGAPLPPYPGAYSHGGFYLRVGFGLGYLEDSLRLDQENSAPASPVSMTLHGVAVSFDGAVGGTVNGIVIGVELLGADVYDPSLHYQGNRQPFGLDTVTLMLIGPMIDYYPDPERGFHMQLAAGYSELFGEDAQGNSTVDNPRGAGFCAGIGYEFWIQPEWSVGFMGRFSYSYLVVHDTLDGVPVREQDSILLPTLELTGTYH